MINKIHKVFYLTPLYALFLLIIAQFVFSQTTLIQAVTYQSVEGDPFKANLQAGWTYCLHDGI
jgi:hypothetical protein